MNEGKKLDRINNAYQSGEITYTEAERQATPIVEAMNQTRINRWGSQCKLFYVRKLVKP